MTTQQRTYLHADGDDGADPQINLTRFWLGIIVIIIAAVAVAGWLFVQ